MYSVIVAARAHLSTTNLEPLSLFSSGLRTGLVFAEAATAATAEVDRGACGRNSVLAGESEVCWTGLGGGFSVVRERPREVGEASCEGGAVCSSCFLVEAAVAASRAPADAAGLCDAETLILLDGFAGPGPNARAAPWRAGEGRGEALEEATSYCRMKDGFGATGGRRAFFPLINPLTAGEQVQDAGASKSNAEKSSE
jgi:hypothetical protein